MKATIRSAVFIALLSLSARAQDPAAALKMHVTWFLSFDRHTVTLSLWNTGGNTVTLAPKIPVSRVDPNPPANAPKPRQDDSDSLQATIEFSGNPGQSPVALPAALSAATGNDPVKIDAGGGKDIGVAVGDDFVAASKTPGVTTTFRVKYHDRLLDEIAYNSMGKILKRYDSNRNMVETYTYDETGKQTSWQVSLPDDPALRAQLAAEEKQLLAKLQAAGNNQRARDMAQHDLIVFYMCKSFEYDKAATLGYALTNPANIYNLKMMQALASKTVEEKNKKLEELIQLFPDKKAFTEKLMSK